MERIDYMTVPLKKFPNFFDMTKDQQDLIRFNALRFYTAEVSNGWSMWASQYDRNDIEGNKKKKIVPNPHLQFINNMFQSNVINLTEKCNQMLSKGYIKDKGGKLRFQAEKFTPFIIHGSKNSLDTDVHMLYHRALTKAEAKVFADNHPMGNGNVIHISNGQVAWSYKGSIDECNNAILATFNLHSQLLERCPVTAPMPRNVALKAVRTLRGMLGMLTRSEHRVAVKERLHDPLVSNKIALLKSINLTKVKGFGDRDVVEVKKFYAFQLAQTLALFEGVEIYTKDEAGKKYPKLMPYLQRKSNAKFDDLQAHWVQLLNVLEENLSQGGDIVSVNGTSANVITEMGV